MSLGTILLISSHPDSRRRPSHVAACPQLGLRPKWNRRVRAGGRDRPVLDGAPVNPRRDGGLFFEELTMRYALATTCFVLGAALAPVAAYAADGDTDRANPRTVRQGLGHHDQDQDEAGRGTRRQR